jgi:diguanylate cyclase (GGDEF)-like protein
VLPGVLTLLAAIVAMWLLEDSALQTVSGRYALVLYAVGGLLAAFFHRSRVLVGLLGLAFVDAVVRRAAPGESPLLPLGTLLVALLGVLALVRDRGVRSRIGVVQVLASAVVLYAAYVLFQNPLNVAAFGEVRLLPAGYPEVTIVPQATLVVGAAGLLAAIYGAIRWRGPVERAVVWSQLFLLGSMDPAVSPSESSLLFMAAGLVLSLSVLEQSYSMAYRDELTSLPARRALMQSLAEVGGTYAVAMVDVDHFKNFNDKHGHDVGDQVLQLVASKLAAGPAGGKAFRYGGEEFTLLYPGRVKEDALEHVEAVRDAVQKATFTLRSWNRPRNKPGAEKQKASGKKKKRRPGRLSVTVSVGLADSAGNDPTPDAVLKRADEALYRAKGGGRNRVSV